MINPVHFDKLRREFGGDFIRLLTENSEDDLAAIGQFAGKICPHEEKEQTESGWMTLVVLREYLRCGQQVYVVGPKHQQMFSDTPCDGIPTTFFKLPHKSFYLSFPESCPEIDGVYVYERDPKMFTFLIACNDAKDLGIRIPFFIDEFSALEVSDGVFILDIESAIELGLEEIGASHIYEECREALRIAINTIVHLASGAETETDESALARRKTQESRIRRQFRMKRKMRPKDKEKIRRKISRLNTPIVTWIGKSVENNPDIKVPRRGEKRGTWLARCGHRHHYWVGKHHINAQGKRVGERLILKWVAPVYRFPDNPDGRTREHRFIGDAAHAMCAC